MITKQLYTLFILLALAPIASALTIDSPLNKTYNVTNILLDVSSTQTYDTLEYALDTGSPLAACENCSEFSTTLDLEEGQYALLVEGTYKEKTSINGSNETNETMMVDTETVTFTITLPVVINDTPEVNNTNTTGNETNETVDFTLTINEPEAITYDESYLELDVDASETLDKITLSIANEYFNECENCSNFEGNVTLEEGTYTLRATGILDEESVIETVTFTVEFEHNDSDDDNETDDDDNETGDGDGTPRFAVGYNKLPQALENGEISDSELAQIIRENELNPGVVNRLIKTGNLGEESVDAILENQHNPPGIFKRFLSFIGFAPSTYASEIYEEYELTEEQEEKLLEREDLPKKYTKEVKEKVEKRVKTNPGQAKKAGTQEEPVMKSNGKKADTPSGKPDTSEKTNGKSNAKGGKDKTNPGQAKKNAP